MVRRYHFGSRLRHAIGLSLLLCGASGATQMIALSEVQLVEKSSLIVIGRCTDVRSTWIDRRLMTRATVTVREVLKGEPRAQVTVVIPGGIDAQRPIPVAAVAAGTPQLAPAEEVVLFLSPSPDERDAYAVTGLAQGKLSILNDATAGEVVAFDRGRPPSPLARFRAGILHRVKRGAAQR